jgi:hypothetical protein
MSWLLKSYDQAIFYVAKADAYFFSLARCTKSYAKQKYTYYTFVHVHFSSKVASCIRNLFVQVWRNVYLGTLFESYFQQKDCVLQKLGPRLVLCGA